MAILHTETSNKRFIIQLNLFPPFFSNLKENYKCNKMSARNCTISWDICTRFARFLYNNYSLLAEVSHGERKMRGRRDLCRDPTRFLSRMR